MTSFTESGRWQQVTVGEREMRCYLARPVSPNAPGVLVCMHGPGVDGFITTMCDRLASAGLGAIAPDLYYRQSRPAATPREAAARLQDAEVLVDLDAATEVLRATDGIDGDRLAVVGFCMGGRLSFLLAANRADLRAAVVFYGGDIRVPKGDGPSPLEQAGNITAPLLGLFGADDENPSPADVAAIDAELDRLGVPHEFHTYAGAGHAFLHFGRAAAFRAEAAADAWESCASWLTRHL
jgi:carboxymethylenebutenolidase